jgi:hypothetical protein
MRKKDKRLSNPFRNLRHKPYGMVYLTGYGGEYYGRDPRTGRMTEGLGIVINKKRFRFNGKKFINNELNEYYE